MLLDRYEQEQRSLFGELRQGLTRLYTTTEEERLWTINGQNAVLSYAAQMIKAAKVEVLLVLADEHLEALGARIRAACKGGVAIKALLTGAGNLDCGEIARHPPLESEMQEMTGLLVAVVDRRECLIASGGAETSATITTNRNLVLIARQFVWMELFSQRIYTRLGQQLLEALDLEDRRVFEGLSP
jgi:Cd2+/Zn2+-exporting ATPase